jgi:hypothetical protein
VDENKTSPNVGDEELEDDDESGLVDTESRLAIRDCATFREHFTEQIEMIQQFCGGLEYQLQFEDHRMLETL